MNYLSHISHRILVFGKFWPTGIFLLEAGYHFKKYKGFVALQRRDSHIKKSQAIVWSPEWPTQTLLVTITSELVLPSPMSSFLKIGPTHNYLSPGRAPVHHSLSLHKMGEKLLLAKAQGPFITILSKPRLSNALRKTFSPMSLKSKKEKRTAHY